MHIDAKFNLNGELETLIFPEKQSAKVLVLRIKWKKVRVARPTSGARWNLEARALAAVSGVKEDRSEARISLSAADAGHRRHIIALGLIALPQRPWNAVKAV